MRIVTQDEPLGVAGGRAAVQLLDEVSRRATRTVGPVKIPADSGARVALAKKLRDVCFAGSGPVFLYITEWGVWPSCEQMDVFEKYRAALGENRSLRDAPVHLFSRGDAETFCSLTAIVLLFCWGAEVFGETSEFQLTLSHDEWAVLRISSETSPEAIALRRVIEGLEESVAG